MTTKTSRPQSALRRTIAGIAAAGAIALGGVGVVSSSDAAAAGVRNQTYVVQPSNVQVQSTSTGTPKRAD